MNLTEIKEAVNKKYASLPLDWEDEKGLHSLQLRNVLRLSDKEQQEAEALGEAMSASENKSIASIRETFVKYLSLLSGDAAGVKQFVKAIDGDLAIMVHVAETYQKETQAEKA